jgi:hypothetical protein
LPLLVLLAVVRSAAGTHLDSFTIDEAWHIVAGVSYVRYGDFAVNPEHPPLVKLWTGAWMGDAMRVGPTPALREKDSEREWTAETMYRGNDARAVQSRARVAMWTFHALFLVILGALLGRAFGWPWAVATIAFLAVEPTVAAHLPVVMTDLPVALTLLIAAVCLGLLAATWRWGWALATGAALGLALGSKHSALPGVVGLFAFGGVAVAWSVRGSEARVTGARALKLLSAGVLALAVLWAQYAFRFHARPDGSDGFNRAMAAKVDDLRMPRWRAAIHGADTLRIAPRAYLWGLADTVRAGIEGRRTLRSFVWGRRIEGRAPWYVWPSLILSKVPLALLAMTLLGAAVLWRMPLSLEVRWCLAATMVMALAHGAALLTSQKAYGGVRHALPIVAALAVLAGASVSRAWAARPRWRVAAVAPIAVALAMTSREPRLWEYHNELAGGSTNGWQQFDNEGVDIGQRFHEVHAYYDATIAPTGLPLHYRGNWSPTEAKAAGIVLPRRAEALEDDEPGETADGWFVIPMRLHRTLPDWDPAIGLRGLTPMARFGFVEIWRGRQSIDPALRVRNLFELVNEHVYRQGGEDWPLVARRTQEILDLRPNHVGARFELANAHLRMGHRDEARAAYQAVLDQGAPPVDQLTRDAVTAQIARIDASAGLSAIAPLRHSWME